jgi:hypothetical protein
MAYYFILIFSYYYNKKKSRHDIAEILLELMLNTKQLINQSISQSIYYNICIFFYF